MKNKLFALMVFALFLLAIPMALAQENNNTTENECSVDTDCDEDEYCTTEFECEDKEDENETECTVGSDCGEGFYCDDGECEEDETECSVDTDCEENEYCTTEFECEDKEDETECSVDADCETGFTCDDGECEVIEEDEIECSVDADCDGDEYCDDGECEDKEDENETISNETKVMRNSLGANIRLMMLEKSVTWAIMRGEVVVNYFEDNGKDATRMDEILERLSAIVSTSRDMREDKNLSSNKYAELRVESVQLVSEFKRITWNDTNAEERQEIRQLLSELNDTPIKELKEEIKEYIKEYNAEKVKEIMEKLGEKTTEIEKKIRDGDMTAAQARERIREEYSKLSEEEKEAAKLKLEEAIEQAKEIRERTLEQLRTETEAKIRERIENRIRTTTDEIQILEEIKTRVRQR